MKKILYAVGISAALLLILFLGYYLSGGRGNAGPGNDTGSVGTLPSDQQRSGSSNDQAGAGDPSSEDDVGFYAFTSESLRLVYDKPVDSYFVENTGAILVVQKDGQIVKVGSDGKAETLSSAPIPTLVASAFSFDGRKIMTILGTHMDRRVSVFDTVTKSWSGPIAGVEAASWSPHSQELAYLKVRTIGGYQLISQDFKTASGATRTLLTIPVNDLLLSWIHPERITLQERSAIEHPGSVWLFVIRKKTLSPVVTDAFGLTTRWDPSATQMVAFSAVNNRGQGGSAVLRTDKGSLVDRLRFVTLPEKCFFEKETQPGTPVTSTLRTSPWLTASKFLICGVPRDNPTFSDLVLPDDYQKKAAFTTDNIYRIDLANGDIEFIFADANKYFDVFAMSTRSERLYFLNNFDNKLYSLSFIQSP